MKNIRLCAPEHLILAARAKARAQGITLDDAFREWLESYVGAEAQAKQAMQLIAELHAKVKMGVRKFTRDEMNER
jgi:hypothetical protein